MALKYFNPVTPSLRSLVSVDKSSLWSGKPEKKLTIGLPKTGGRNNFGRITTRHVGGRHKRLYRLVDFKRDLNSTASVERLEYDPNRGAFIALLNDLNNGKKSYILAADGICKDSILESGENVEIKDGNCLPLKNIPVGTVVHNIEIKPGRGGQLVRSAGVFAVVIGKSGNYAQIRLPSKEIRLILLSCKATIGVLSNADHKNIVLGKAGRNRWLGVRPTVRGVAMNPVDHPHGGGEGKTSGGRHPVSPWGKLTKGKKTRSNKSTNCFIVKKRSVK